MDARGDKVNGGKVKKKASLKTKAKTKMWSDVVKGLEEDESETTNSVEKSDRDETDH